MPEALSDNYNRIGTAVASVLLQDPSASVSIASTVVPTFTLSSAVVSSTALQFVSGKRFNVDAAVPGSQYSVKLGYRGYDASGNISVIDLSSAVTITPGATHNALAITVTNVSAAAVEIVVLINGIVTDVVPVPLRTINEGISTETLNILIPYEPSIYGITEADYNALKVTQNLLRPKQLVVGKTTGGLNFSQQLSKVAIEIDGQPTINLITKDTKSFTGNFVGVKEKVKALFAGGTHNEPVTVVSAAVPLTSRQGIRTGQCTDSRYFKIVVPGDSCNNQLFTVLQAHAVTGADTIEQIFGDSDAANVSFTIQEFPDSIKRGTHTLQYRTA